MFKGELQSFSKSIRAISYHLQSEHKTVFFIATFDMFLFHMKK